MHYSRSRRGFTLIELLVVIAIIAILAAILFPVFAQARESARAISCLSNMKQLGLGVMQYVQDYDERYPTWMYTTNLGTPDLPWGPWQNNHTGWDKAIYPYVKNVQIYKCPDVTDGVYTDANGTCGGCSPDDSKPTGAISYYMNGWIADRLNSRGTQMARLNYPAVTILLGETSRAASTGAVDMEINWLEWGWQGGHSHRLNGDNNADAGWDGNTYGTIIPQLCHQGNQGEWGESPPRLRVHKGGANYTLADGHAKFYPGDASCIVWDRSNSGGGTPKNESGGSLTYDPTIGGF